MKNNSSLSGSFLNAVRGIHKVLAGQRNFYIEIVISLLVVASGFYFVLNPVEWCIILLCIALVISLEAINTAIEHLADAVIPDFDPLIGKAKDVSAGAVLIASVFAGITGIIIFAPRIAAIFTD
jgi:diacylglycerol kinase